MKIVRTKSVELTLIPAIAYKQRLTSGGAGIKILRLDTEATATATIDKSTGEPVPYGKIDETLFPIEAFEEAIELTHGMPYSGRQNIKIDVSKYSETIEEPEEERLNVVESDEYKAIIERYCDEKGKLNYTLMNKDFIKFASKSKTVESMVANNVLAEDILIFIIKSRSTFIANKKESLNDEHIKALIETLDEINTRSAFKELRNYIKKLLSKRKK
ncbi:hypothetical protein [Sebaldella termitidis]|uniref:hypothetical protein n=1 Tax=Sebaldella termitidis TaxID=826 RepID=UPI003EC04697